MQHQNTLYRDTIVIDQPFENYQKLFESQSNLNHLGYAAEMTPSFSSSSSSSATTTPTTMAMTEKEKKKIS